MRGADEIRFHIGGAEMRLTFALNNMHVYVLYKRINCVVGVGKTAYTCQSRRAIYDSEQYFHAEIHAI